MVGPGDRERERGMGYNVVQEDTSFRVSVAKQLAALAAVKDLARKGTYRWVDNDEYFHARDLLQALEAWLWYATIDVHGNVTGLVFQGEKMGDEDILFAAIAPFVEPGSFIQMLGEEGERWRYCFDGQAMRQKQAPAIDWDTVPFEAESHD